MEHRGKCYLKIEADGLTYTAASEACKKVDGGVIVAPRTADEHEVLAGIMGGNHAD